ncbi:MAG: hypothetical protein E7299_08705 [Lachnospiraceae bacterium]|nr:hypothetical protein [Lachnospiraceae bacterium]
MLKAKSVFWLMVIMSFILISCGNGGQGTYFPDSSEMQNNLKDKKYEVNVQEIQNDEYSGTRLTAKKGNEYIAFFWLDESEGIETLEQELKTNYPDYTKMVSMENDSNYGTFIFASSDRAMDDAGIVIVEVKVNT